MSAHLTTCAPIPWAKLEPSPEDLSAAAHAISDVLVKAKADIYRIIEGVNANLDKEALRHTLDAHLSDCDGDVTVPIEEAAEQLLESRYSGIRARGPFVRVRR